MVSMSPSWSFTPLSFTEVSVSWSAVGYGLLPPGLTLLPVGYVPCLSFQIPVADSPEVQRSDTRSGPADGESPFCFNLTLISTSLSTRCVVAWAVFWVTVQQHHQRTVSMSSCLERQYTHFTFALRSRTLYWGDWLDPDPPGMIAL
jgi:hypothetical protein